MNLPTRKRRDDSTLKPKRIRQDGRRKFMSENSAAHPHKKSPVEIIIDATADAVSNKAQLWLKIGQMFGVPMVILIAVGFAVAQVYSDCKPLAIKFVDKQIALMDVLTIHAK